MDGSPFGSISPELRNVIYTLLIEEDKQLRAQDKTMAIRHIVPPIAQVCAQIRNEVLLMAFADCIFVRNLGCRECTDPEEHWPRGVFDVTFYTNVGRFRKWLEAIDDKRHTILKLRLRLDFDLDVLDEESINHDRMMGLWTGMVDILVAKGYKGSGRLILEPYDRHEYGELESFIAAGLKRLDINLSIPKKGKDALEEDIPSIEASYLQYEFDEAEDEGGDEGQDGDTCPRGTNLHTPG